MVSVPATLLFDLADPSVAEKRVTENFFLAVSLLFVENEKTELALLIDHTGSENSWMPMAE